MAVRVQNFPKKNISQPSIHPMPHCPFTTTAWWNSQEEQFHQPLSKSLSLKVGSPLQACQAEKHVCRQPQDQYSPSTQSTYQSHQEVAALGGNSSQDQCISSNSAQDESYRKHVEGQVKPVLILPNPSFGVNPPQVDINPSMAHIPYTYGDPYVNGLYTAYGPQAIIQPSVIAMAPARVPLPVELAEDGPIYVNAKQYHGILRRRQIRARLEAQNKLLKNRKVRVTTSLDFSLGLTPFSLASQSGDGKREEMKSSTKKISSVATKTSPTYLHESRHLHALNRVRGSGGRFLSTKKTKPSNPSPCSNSDIDSDSVNQVETGKCEASSTSSSIAHVNETDVFFQQADHRFSNISSQIGGSRGLMCSGTRHHYPVVR